MVLTGDECRNVGQRYATGALVKTKPCPSAYHEPRRPERVVRTGESSVPGSVGKASRRTRAAVCLGGIIRRVAKVPTLSEGFTRAISRCMLGWYRMMCATAAGIFVAQRWCGTESRGLMISLSSVIVDVDAVAAEHAALVHAVELAVRCGARLEIVDVLPFVPPSTRHFVTSVVSPHVVCRLNRLRRRTSRSREPGTAPDVVDARGYLTRVNHQLAVSGVNLATLWTSLPSKRSTDDTGPS